MSRPSQPTCPKCGELVPDSAGEGWWVLRASMPDEVKPVYEAAVKRLRGEGLTLHRSPRIAAGQVIEALAAEYCAS